ncbi:hypothetical protein ACV8SR_20790 [Citrobacter freundii]|uniref:hypothetical protein n=1 Tax=Citrobacter freundii TaxID=546 RepID=UPI0023B0539B|nr:MULTISPECIES: hypothetical protein [Citrobacter]MDU2297404.1 hypothetical protein [Citrobacter freundii]MDU3247186.1 hypothetical protein [Citrobacter freundii]MDU7742331.1 hypothetical protein [Citrobacter sp.]MDU7937459.1 hypothetical protein [Citrobacter freundii]
MKQRLPTYLYQNKLSDKQRDLNDTVHYVFWLLTLIASYTPDKSIVYLSFHRAMSITQQEGIPITPARFYQAIDKLIDMKVIMPTEFKYQFRLNPVFFSFLKKQRVENKSPRYYYPCNVCYSKTR